MSQLWQTVLAIIGSIGGAGIIIIAVVKFTSNIIAERLSQKYELRLNKELESYKASIDKKTYISKSRFDMEFAIYGKLSEAFLSMVDAVYWLFPQGLDRLPTNDEARNQIYVKRFEKAGLEIDNATKVIGANAPFIPKNVFSSFEEVRKLCTRQYNMYTWCGELFKERSGASTSGASVESTIQMANQCYERTDEISQKYAELITQLREYLENLEVVEE